MPLRSFREKKGAETDTIAPIPCVRDSTTAKDALRQRSCIVENTRLIRTVARTGLGRAPLWLAISLFWLWPWLLATYLSRLENGAPIPSPFVFHTRLGLFLALGLFLLALALLYYRRGLQVPAALTPLLAGASLTAASCLSFVPLDYLAAPTTFSAAVHLLRSCFGAVGIGLLCLLCGQAFALAGTRQTLFCVCLGSFVGAAAFMAVASAPDFVLQLVLLGLSLGSFVLLRPLGALVGKDGEPPSEPLPQSRHRPETRAPWKLMITVALWAGSFGAFSFLFENTPWPSLGPGAYLIASLAVLPFVGWPRIHYNDLLYKVGFLTLGAALSLALFAGCLVPASYGLFSFGYRFIELFIWGLYVHLIRTRGLSPYWTIALNVGIWTLSRYGGFVIAASVLKAVPTAESPEALALTLALLLILLVGALFLSNHNNFAEGWGIERVADEARSDRQTDYSCRVVAEHFGLSPKEAEILSYIMRGDTRREIGAALFVSPETVKTHIRHIYGKTGVNSQEALRDLVARTGRSLDG